MTLDDNSIMPFGKYKGQTLGIIPGSYFMWLGLQKWFIKSTNEWHKGMMKYIEDNAQCFVQEHRENLNKHRRGNYFGR